MLSGEQLRTLAVATAALSRPVRQLWQDWQKLSGSTPQDMKALSRATLVHIIEEWYKGDKASLTPELLLKRCPDHRPFWYKVKFTSPAVYRFYTMESSSWKQPRLTQDS